MKKKGYHMIKHGVTVDDHDGKGPGTSTQVHGAKKPSSYPSHASIEAAGHEMKMNPPKQLAKTAKKYGKARAKKQKIAIMLSKARKGK